MSVLNLPTQIRAHISIQSHAKGDAIRVFRLIKSAGERGMTCDEVETVTRMSHQTASARITQLLQSRWVQMSGYERPTASGRMANAYIPTPKADRLELKLRPAQAVNYYAVTRRRGKIIVRGPYPSKDDREDALHGKVIEKRFTVRRRTGEIEFQ